MNSNDFMKEAPDLFSGSQNMNVSSDQVRKVFLQDFLNDAFHAINTGIKTGVINLNTTSAQSPQSTQTSQQTQPASTTFAEPITQTPQGQDLAAKRAERQKAVQAQIDQTSKPQYNQPKALTPSQIRQAKQKAAAAKVDQQTKQQYAQSKTVNKSATKDPATVLEALDYLGNAFLTEQETSVGLSDYIIDFFDDYVSAANANYSKYQPQIKNLANQIEAEWKKNPRGTFGIGYSRKIRELLTQLGDVALLTYKLKKGTTATTVPDQKILRSALDYVANRSFSNQPGSSKETTISEPVTWGGEQYILGPNGWVDSKGKPADKKVVDNVLNRVEPQTQSTPSKIQQFMQFVNTLNAEEKEQLINSIIKTLPSRKDVSY